APNDAVLIEIAERQAPGTGLTCARNGQVMRLPVSGVAHEIEPVRVRGAKLANVRRRVRGYGGPVLRRVQHVGKLVDRGRREARAVLELGTAAPPGLSGDKHHATGAVRAIDRRGRGIP